MRNRAPLLALAILAAGVTSPAAWAGCVTPQERAAKTVRYMQIQLMVGALQCRGDRDLGQRELYNRFIIERRSELAQHGRTLIAHFRRSHGHNPQAALDNHITGLANLASAQSRETEDFCTAIAAFAHELLGDPARDIVAAAARAPIPLPDDEPLCPASSPTASVD